MTVQIAHWKSIARNNLKSADIAIVKLKTYLWYPASSPAFRIMPETITPARGSRNLTPRIEPPKVEINGTRLVNFTSLNSTRFPRKFCQDHNNFWRQKEGKIVRCTVSLVISPNSNLPQMDFDKHVRRSILNNI